MLGRVGARCRWSMLLLVKVWGMFKQERNIEFDSHATDLSNII